MSVFTNCNVCGKPLRTDAEDQMGMCDSCAGECGEEEISREIDRLRTENAALQADNQAGRAHLRTMREAGMEGLSTNDDEHMTYLLAAMSGLDRTYRPNVTAAIDWLGEPCSESE